MEEYYAVNDFRGYLQHYGIKGMHWGVRRYQNSDGSLTEAGKKRAQKEKDKEIRDLNKSYNQSLKKLDFEDKILNSKLMRNSKNKDKKLESNKKMREIVEKMRKKEIDFVKNTEWKDLVDIRKKQDRKHMLLLLAINAATLSVRTPTAPAGMAVYFPMSKNFTSKREREEMAYNLSSNEKERRRALRYMKRYM